MVNLYLVSLEIQPQWSGLLTGIASDLVGCAKNTLVLYGVSSSLGDKSSASSDMSCISSASFGIQII